MNTKLAEYIEHVSTLIKYDFNAFKSTNMFNTKLRIERKRQAMLLSIREIESQLLLEQNDLKKFNSIFDWFDSKPYIFDDFNATYMMSQYKFGCVLPRIGSYDNIFCYCSELIRGRLDNVQMYR